MESQSIRQIAFLLHGESLITKSDYIAGKYLIEIRGCKTDVHENAHAEG